MKTDNLVNGKYFAGLMKEVFADLEDAKYTNLELRWNFFTTEFFSLTLTQVVNLWAIPPGVGQSGLVGRSLEQDTCKLIRLTLSLKQCLL